MSDNPLEFTPPNDLASCHALLQQFATTIHGQQNTIEQLQREKEEIELAYKDLYQRAFLKRRERYINNPDQLRLDFNNTDDAADAADGLADAVADSQQQVESYTRRRPRKRRDEGLPEHLLRYEVQAPMSDERKHCPEHGERTLIGYDTTETLEIKRPELRVRVTKYPKYACAQAPECGIASPERLPALVEGNRYDTSVAAEIMTAKYGYHLPVYRQQDLFAGCGWKPQRSTLLNILVAAASVIHPLVQYIKKIVLGDAVVGTDETRVTLLLPGTIPKPDPNDPKSQRTYEVFSEALAAGRRSVPARMWAYRGVTIPLQVFDFTVSRHRDGPDLMLADYEGILLADCYSGYQGITMRSAGRIRRAACSAHARRKVFDAKDVYPLEASLLLAWFQQLYDLEDRGRSMSVDERLALRQREAVPIWQALRAWLDGEAAARVLPKSKLGEALGYLRNHWTELQTYLSDGRVPIDNNEVEHLMKQVALGRKNWLFIGSVPAGERAADLLTLVSSAVRNDLDVWVYIKDVLDRLLAGETDYEALRPDIWRQSHPEAIRDYRVIERRDRADRKQFRRSNRRRQSI